MSDYKKILIITSEFPPGPGGIGNHAYNLAKYLRLNNVGIRVLTVSDYADKESEKKFDSQQNFNIFRFPRFKSRLWTYLRRIKIILYTLKNKEFTHIIFSGRFSLLVSLILAKYHEKIKFVAIAHGGEINADNFLIRSLVNNVLKKMDLIIPVSRYSKSKLLSNLNQDKIVVIPNGFDFENIDKLKVSEKVLEDGSINLVTVGTVGPRKGQHNVLNALQKILSDYSKTKYHIIGRLADLTKVKTFLEDERYKNHLKVYGSISNEEMHNVLNESQIFLLLSESQSSGDFEGFGIAVLEANYFGLPAIGSKNSGLEDSINHGVNGLLVDPHNSNEVSEAIKTIANNYSKFSENARAWAMQHHWSKIVQRYIKAIEKIS